MWWGPYFIPRPREWCPSHFTLYEGTLYGRLFIPPRSYGLSWKMQTHEVNFDRGFSNESPYLDQEVWIKALSQMEHRHC